jgi:hypothetical protein
MTAPVDYGGIIAGVLSALKADATLTAMLGMFTPAGGTPSQANSIFSGTPPTGRVFPCVTLWDMRTGAADAQLQDVPFKYAASMLQIDCWGVVDALRPIAWEIDNLLALAYRSGAMDNANWQFDFIQTSGDWRSILVPKEFVDGSEEIYQWSKVFRVKAASKN